jgi:hypothetical protein
MSIELAANPAQGTRPGLLRAPWVGLLGFALIWLWKPIAHTLSVLMRAIDDPALLTALNLGLGTVGFLLIWRGLKLTELPATWMGFLGGALIWIGWFEFSFEYFAHAIGVDPILYLDGRMGLPASFALMQATSFLMLALFLFFAANKDTGCRFFQWLHRNLGMRPGVGTPGYQRQFARIAALELIMTNWFCYIVILCLYDPRIAGREHPLAYAGGALIAALSFYLIFFKLREQRSIAPALRYGIGVVAVFWLLCELTAAWGWYAEVWVRPKEYPIIDSLFLIFFVAGIVYTLRHGKQSEIAT